MANFPGPYELEFKLESAGFASPHVVRMNVNCVTAPELGTLFADIDLMTKAGTGKAADLVAEQAWSFLRLFYATSVSVSEVILWHYIDGTYSKDFVSTYEVLTAPAGAGGTTKASGYIILTYRTALGGIAKLTLLEPNIDSDASVSIGSSSPTSPQRQISNYLVSADSPMIGRDNAFLIASLKWSAGQNERIWRKRNRP